MKLKFNIHYETAWGQSLHVVIIYKNADGRQKVYNLPMLTDDGMHWALETVVMETRQHPVVALSYHYQLEDAEGQVLRSEWDMIPRIYSVDNTKDYVFSDLWRDVPLQQHLYTYAFATTSGRGRSEEVDVPRLPVYRKTIVFRVSAPQLRKGESLAICGNHPAMGNWNPSLYLRMNYIGDGDWMLTVNVDMIALPLDYKYVVVDDATRQVSAWEEGDNRTTGSLSLADGQVLVLYGETLRLKEDVWRCAGVVVPVFSLRSAHSCGVGDFGDLRRFVDWAKSVGLRVVQVLPLNDTTRTHSWSDSNPYSAISAFALHPHYLDLEQLGRLKDEAKRTAYQRQRNELNALSFSDYMAVDRVKTAYIDDVFAERGEEVLSSDDFGRFMAANEDWLKPYADYCLQQKIYKCTREQIYYVQYNLHVQLKQAAEHARECGIVLKGDLPIGVYRDSVETSRHPEFFNMQMQMGTPPQGDSPFGQNWGFPPYRWQMVEGKWMLEDWFVRRLRHLEEYFDAIRIDHVIGYFRSWEIPVDAVYSSMGHFSPALPMSEAEIGQFGIAFRKELFTRPFINDSILDKIFGIHAQYVRENFFVKKAYGLYDLKEEYDSQKKVLEYFRGRNDENSVWIRDGLCRLVANVLFIEDMEQPGMYHPRFGARNAPVYEVLGGDERNAFNRLYDNYFYERHNDYWAYMANKKLSALFGKSRLLLCAEDMGMLPACVAPVLDAHRILSLEMQTMPKEYGFEFVHLSANPYRSVATISTHDMPTLRQWWEENPGRTQRYYVTMLQKEGRAPQHLPAHVAEEIIARHLYCPSMMCVLALQDWLAMDMTLRGKDVQDERINTPFDSYNQWKYKMPVTIEKLMAANQLNNKLRTMITRSQRL